VFPNHENTKELQVTAHNLLTKAAVQNKELAFEIEMKFRQLQQ